MSVWFYRSKLNSVLTVLFVVALLCSRTAEAQTVNAVGAAEVAVVLNGEMPDSGTTAKLITETAYVPLQSVFEKLGADVFWDVEARMMAIASGEKQVLVELLGSQAVVNGAPLEVGESSVLGADKELLVPVRLVAEGLGMDVYWDADSSQLYVTTAEYLRANGAPYAQPVVSCTEAELDLFTHVVFAEARDEPYEGYVAVAAVIINRVLSPDFPNTLHDVLLQPGQFRVIENGTYRWEPDDWARGAVEAALRGVDPSQEALFFFDPSRSSSDFMFSRPVTVVIGNHRFTR